MRKSTIQTIEYGTGVALQINEGSTRFQGIISQDHKGRWYDSRTAMCDQWGIRDSTFLGRINRGYSVEDALTKPVAEAKKPSTDHRGIRFDSKNEMCRFYGIKNASFRDRIRRGWSLEDALTKEIEPQVKKTETRLGEKGRMKNGLEAAIVGYENAKSVKVLFEDGALGMGTRGNFSKGKIGHPTLRMRGKGTFCGFETNSPTRDTETGEVTYKCRCLKCGVSSTLTPQQMMAHFNVCYQG